MFFEIVFSRFFFVFLEMALRFLLGGFWDGLFWFFLAFFGPMWFFVGVFFWLFVVFSLIFVSVVHYCTQHMLHSL